MEAQHMSQQVFASYIGTTPATLSGIFNERTRPTISIIESIKKKFPDISLDWLMFGQGTMFQKDQVSDEQNLFAPDDLFSSQSDHANQNPNSSHVFPTPQNQHQSMARQNGVRITHPEFRFEDVKNLDKIVRQVTEIRVYYDDQTWESFVPSKKMTF